MDFLFAVDVGKHRGVPGKYSRQLRSSSPVTGRSTFDDLGAEVGQHPAAVGAAM